MQNMDKIKEVEKRMSKEQLYGLVLLNSGVHVVKEFMETTLSEKLKETATTEAIYNYLDKKIFPYIKVTPITKLIASKDDFKFAIKTGANETLDVLDYLNKQVLPTMTQDRKFFFGGKTQTIEEIYDTILKNEYQAPTLEDYKEICVFILDQIDDNVRKSEFNGMTFEEYVLNSIPPLMTSFETININGEEKNLEEYIVNVATKQQSMLLNLNDPNRTHENPGLVEEIKIALEDNNIFTPEKLDALKDLANSVLEEVSDKKKLYSILDVIDDCSKERELNNLLLRVNVIEQANNDETKELISVIKNRIEKKRRSIIKINNNKGDLLTSANKHIELLKRKIDEEMTLTDDGVIIGLLTTFENSLDELNIKDELAVKLDTLNKYREYKGQTIKNSTGEYKNIAAAYVEIEKELEVIKKTMDYLEETEDIFFDSLVRSLSYKIEDLNATIKAAISSNSISVTDGQKYTQMLNGIVSELETKNKTGNKVI